MKEELQSKLVEILTSIQTAAGKASDFALGQLPDVAVSYITYGRVSYTLYLCVGIVFLCVAAFVLPKARHHSCMYYSLSAPEDREHGAKADMYWPFVLIPGFIGAALVILFTHETLLVWFAPKVWLLKEIASLLK